MSKFDKLFDGSDAHLIDDDDEECKHEAWLIEHSMKRKTCYSCGKTEPTENNMPVHTR